jgi:8-oxo-dGTP diphosphatase
MVIWIDESFHAIEKEKSLMPQATVAAIITTLHDGLLYILLTRRATEPFKGDWCLPGGHIDPYENARTAIIREVKEETGLDFIEHFFGNFDEIIPDQNIHAVVSVYSGEGTGKIEIQPSEVKEIKWFTLAECLSLTLAFDHHHIVEVFVSSNNQPNSHVPGVGIVEEYTTLQNEILKRIELRQEIMTFTLVIAGTILTLGVQFNQTLALLIFPVLSMLLTLVWVQNDVRVGEIGEYIRMVLAPRFEGIYWESYLRKKYAGQKLRLAEIAALGVFGGTGIFSVLLALTKAVFSREEIVLLVVDVVSIALTYFFIQRRRITLHPKSKAR